jgi:hypothetical protein
VSRSEPTVDIDALATAKRLAELGVIIRSPELNDQARRLVEFRSAGGNRAMRRAAACAAKRSGAGRTLRVGGAKVR